MKLLLSILLITLSIAAGIAPKTIQAFVPSREKTSIYHETLSQLRLRVSKRISTFEKSDFPLPTGSWPYTETDMARLDPSDDSNFYDTPRFLAHIDNRAIESLTAYYRDEFNDVLNKKIQDPTNNNAVYGLDVLDICSSWISHLPSDVGYSRVAGIGMNEQELASNEQLTEHYLQDLNKEPMLNIFEDNSFDVVCNVVSVDYLVKPLQVFQETKRILRPGGVCLISFSNRCFPSKAVSMWLRSDDIGRLGIVGSYFHYSGEWESIEALNIKLPSMEIPEKPSLKNAFSNPSAAWAWASAAAQVARVNTGDPIFVVRGVA